MNIKPPGIISRPDVCKFLPTTTSMLLNFERKVHNEVTRAQRQVGKTPRSISSLNIKSLPFAGAAALFVVLLASGLMEAQRVAGENRPATVPAGYVITPFGYFHPTCFKRLSQGDTLLKDEDIVRHADGSSDSLQVCSYPHYDAHGTAASDAQEKAMSPSISRSWIEAYSLRRATNQVTLRPSLPITATTE